MLPEGLESRVERVTWIVGRNAMGVWPDAWHHESCIRYWPTRSSMGRTSGEHLPSPGWGFEEMKRAWAWGGGHIRGFREAGHAESFE
jgi:hypothetical protein